MVVTIPPGNRSREHVAGAFCLKTCDCLVFRMILPISQRLAALYTEQNIAQLNSSRVCCHAPIGPGDSERRRRSSGRSVLRGRAERVPLRHLGCVRGRVAVRLWV
jgi:hypothetical protein